MEPYQTLANAIVEQAAKDYKTVLKYHYTHPEKKAYADQAADLEHFFHSGWFGLLTNLNGDVLMAGIQSLTRKEMVA